MDLVPMMVQRHHSFGIGQSCDDAFESKRFGWSKSSLSNKSWPGRRSLLGSLAFALSVQQMATTPVRTARSTAAAAATTTTTSDRSGGGSISSELIIRRTIMMMIMIAKLIATEKEA
jgi:hypothetical protein